MPKASVKVKPVPTINSVIEEIRFLVNYLVYCLNLTTLNARINSDVEGLYAIVATGWSSDRIAGKKQIQLCLEPLGFLCFFWVFLDLGINIREHFEIILVTAF